MSKKDHAYGYLEQFPALTYHYGLSFSELASMPRVFLHLYIDKLEALKASKQLDMIEAASFPHAKPEAQRKVMRQLNRIIEKSQPEVPTQAIAKSPILMQSQLGAIGVGVTFVDADGNEYEPEPEPNIVEEEVTEDA